MKTEQDSPVGADSEEIAQHIDNLKHKSGIKREKPHNRLPIFLTE